MLEVELLGGLRITWQGAAPTRVVTPRLGSLLAFLLLRWPRAVPRAELAGTFWPDVPDELSRSNVRKGLHRLRQILPEADRYVDLGGQEIRWRTDAPVSLDVLEFERLAGGDDVPSLQAAARLYRGDLVPQCYDDWIAPERERLRELYGRVLRRLIWIHEERREYEPAIRYARQLMRTDPLAEDAYGQLMRVLALKGDRTSAIAVYRRGRDVLARELGVEPGPAMRSLFEHLSTRPERLKRPTAGLPPLVGRESEWATLWQLLQSAGSGCAQCALLVGEPGVGKTRLAEELLAGAADLGWTGAYARCYPSEGTLAYALVTAWLRARPLPRIDACWRAEVARVLPEADDDGSAPETSAARPQPWQRHRLFEGLARAILAGEPLALVADDLQWCDRDTLEWLAYLLRYAPRARLLLVAAVRAGEPEDSGPLARLLTALRARDQLTVLPVEPLDAQATGHLAQSVAGRPLQPQLQERLYRETGGNPLFVLETVRQGLPRGLEASTAGLPSSVDAVIAQRLGALSERARQMSGLAAAVGQAFTMELLTKTRLFNEAATVRAIEELCRRRMVHEIGTGLYDFTHDRLREVAYRELSPARQRWYHRRLAEALEATAAAGTDRAARIAAQWEGAQLPARAVRHYQEVALSARQVHAHGVAIRAYLRLLALLPVEERPRVLLQLGETYQLTGQFVAAGERYREALALAVAGGDRTLEGWCRTRLGRLLMFKRLHRESLAELMTALQIWEASNAGSAMREVLWILGTGHRFEGEFEAALAHFARVATMAREDGDLWRAGEATGQQGLIHHAQGATEQAARAFSSQYSLASEAGDLLGVLRALAWLAELCAEQGDAHRARICHSLGLERSFSLVGQNRERVPEREGAVFWELADMPVSPADHAELSLLGAKLGDLWAVAVFAGHLGWDCLALDALDDAERCFTLALAFESTIPIPYNRCRHLHGLAEVACRQGHTARAQDLAQEAWRWAERMRRTDVGLAAWGLSLCISVSGDASRRNDSITAAEALLSRTAQAADRAQIHQLLWQLDPRREGDRTAAARLLRQLHRRHPCEAHRRAYMRLAGRPLPRGFVPPLPSQLPSQVPPLDALLSRLETVRGDLGPAR